MSETYSVYFGTDPGDLELLASGLAVPQVSLAGEFNYGTVYYWRVDATNEYGTTTGDVWQFGTVIEDPPLPSWSLLPGKTQGPIATWGEDLTLIPPGIEGIDFVWNGINNMRTTRRLVAAANNSLWYEDAT